MNKLAIILTFAFSLMAQAHSTKDIKTMKNSVANKALHAAATIQDIMDAQYGNEGGGVVMGIYKVTEITPAAKPGESMDQTMLRVLKSILHRDYPITGDDGGYSFDVLNGKSADFVLKDVDQNFGLRDLEEGDLASKALATTLALAGKDSSLVVLSGSGSGNNTSAAIVAVLDLKNRELFYLMSSNFGSDN